VKNWTQGEVKSMTKAPRSKSNKSTNQTSTLLNRKGKNPDIAAKLVVPPGFTLLHTFKGHTNWVLSIDRSPNGERLVSGSQDNTIRLWNVKTGLLQTSYTDDTTRVSSVVWSPNGDQLASGSEDVIRLWDVKNGLQQTTLRGHVGAVWSVAWSPSGEWIASGSADRAIGLWSPIKGRLPGLLGSHHDWVRSVAWAPNGRLLASGSDDTTIRLWNPTTGMMLNVLKGHTDQVWSIAWSPDGLLLASGSGDKTIRLWDAVTSRLVRTLEGQMDAVNAVTWSPDGRLLLSSSYNSSFDTNISIWRTDTWELVAALKGLQGFLQPAWHPRSSLVAMAGQRKEDITVWHVDIERLLQTVYSSKTTHYTNAKVVLVGDSGVGKSGLGYVLSGQSFTATESTHGRRVWEFDRQEAVLDERSNETRETLLWDLAGQPGYRLIHQLSLNEVAVALVIFDAHNETDPFAGVLHWDRALRTAQRLQGSSAWPLIKLLVAARIDRGGVGVSAERIQKVVKEQGFAGYFETSAKEGWQINELREAILRTIDWEVLPKVSSTVLFQQIKRFLVDEKKQGKRLLSTIEDLYDLFLNTIETTKGTEALLEQFKTCVGRVEAAGLIKRLSFGNLVLLQPELLDAYASALVNFVKDEPDGLGSIAEEQVRAGNFRIPVDERLMEAEQEKLLLIAMVEDLLRQELILREEDMLVFPSQSTKEHPDMSDPPGKAVVFEFEGPVFNIYATLAVRLARSGVFQKKDLWKNAITYKAVSKGTCGLYLRNIGEGSGELTLFFDTAASKETRRIFEEYVYLHLNRRALSEGLIVHRALECKACGFVIPDEIIQRRKARNSTSISCPVCDKLILFSEQQLTENLLASAHAMDQAADALRDRDAAQSILQGKIETEDFDVFLCHHKVDKPAVRKIGEQLKEHGILPWLDEWELRPGFPWQELLEQQIEHIKAAAVFVGQNGIGPWQQQELAAFLREFVSRGCPVIPVLLPAPETETDSEEPKNIPEKPKLPLFLKAMTWVDFNVKEPDPIQRLTWGITGRRDPSEWIERRS